MAALAFVQMTCRRDSESQKLFDAYTTNPIGQPEENSFLTGEALPSGYTLLRFGVEDGLLSNRVDAVVQDSLGYLWISNGLGLTRYDGKDFSNFKPEKAYGNIWGIVEKMAISPKGEVCYPVSCGEVAFTKNKFTFHEADSSMMAKYDKGHKHILGIAPDMGDFDRWGNKWYLSFNPPADESFDRLSILNPEQKGVFKGSPHLRAEGFMGTILDEAGNYWLQTKKTLYRYNGKKFDSIPVSTGKRISSAFEDSRHNFWLLSMDDTLWQISNSGEINKSGVEEHSYWNGAMGEDAEGKVYIASTHCVTVYSANGVQETQLPLWNIRKITPDHAGRLICSSDSACYAVLDNEVVPVVKQGQIDGSISNVFIDRENNIWLCTTNGLYQCRQTEVAKITLNTAAVADFFHREEGDSVRGADGKKHFEKHRNTRYSIKYADSKGRIWASCFLGLVMYDPLDNKNPYRLFPEIPSLRSDIKITESGNGTIWIGAAGWEYRNDILKRTDNGGLWTFPDDKLSRIRAARKDAGFDENFAVGREINGYFRNGLVCTDHLNRFWAITSHGVLLAQETGARFVETGDTSQPRMIKESAGEIILVSNGSLSKFDEAKGCFTPFCKAPRISGSWFSDLAVDRKGRVWLPVYDEKRTCVLICSRENKIDSVSYAELGLDDPKQLLNHINFLGSDAKGNIWITSTSMGLTFVEVGEEKPIRSSKHLALSEGLSGNLVSGAVLDGKQNLWVLNNFGLDHFMLYYVSKEMMQKTVINPSLNDNTPKIKLADSTFLLLVSRNIGQKEGLDEIYSFSSLQAGIDGSILAGDEPAFCIRGYIGENRIAPVTSISGLTVGNSDSNLVFSDLPDDPVFDYSKNKIGFSYIGTSLTEPGKARYKILLEGYDNKWSAAIDQNRITYTNLREGNYTFHVMASNNSGYFSKPVSFSFTILPPWYRTWWAYSLFLLSGFGLAFSVTRIRTRRLLLRQKRLENIIRDRTAEVMKQKHLLEEKNKEVFDSINYAKRLQNAILPPLRLIRELLPGSFILYLPKDIVAGDFYWIEKTGDLILFAVADCTGHGVPGAMVSVVCSNALNRAVNEFGLADPGKILDKTRDIVLETYSKSEEEVKDGMDISFACLNLSTHELTWAGANNPAWIVRNGELIELQADRQPLGRSDNPRPFTTHRFQMQDCDFLYLSSDGFADQFGEQTNKKFKTANLKKLLVSISGEAPDAQEKLIYKTFMDWKGGNEQVDDVCVMGVKIEFLPHS